MTPQLNVLSSLLDRRRLTTSPGAKTGTATELTPNPPATQELHQSQRTVTLTNVIKLKLIKVHD